MKKIFEGLGLGFLALALVVVVGASSAHAALTLSDLGLDTAAGDAFTLGASNVGGTITIGAANTGGITIGGADSSTDIPGSLTVEGTMDAGTSGAHLTNDTAGGSSVGIFTDSTASTAGQITKTVRVESLDVPSGTTSGGIYAIRGTAGVKVGSTVDEASAPNSPFYAGVQGKLLNNGAMGSGASGSIYATGVLAQINNSGTFGSNAQVYGAWVDNQFTGTMPALSHLLNLTNNGSLMTNAIHVYGNNNFTNFMSAENLGPAAVTITGNASHQVKGLKVVIDGTTYYIPLQNATN